MTVAFDQAGIVSTYETSFVNEEAWADMLRAVLRDLQQSCFATTSRVTHGGTNWDRTCLIMHAGSLMGEVVLRHVRYPSEFGSREQFSMIVTPPRKASDHTR